jgi:hypothetical protein
VDQPQTTSTCQAGGDDGHIDVPVAFHEQVAVVLSEGVPEAVESKICRLDNLPGFLL